MKTETIANIFRILLYGSIIIALIIANTGCGQRDDVETIIQTQNCTVYKSGTDAVIECPDGSSIILPPQIIHEEVITVSPVVIQVPKNRCNKKDK